MEKKQFIEGCMKVANALKGRIHVPIAKKGQHGLIGLNFFPGTERQALRVWNEYGTIYNVVITEPAQGIQALLDEAGITEYKAKPTKSKTMCRLIENK